jgi:PAS domain S-box-containing protein
MAVRLRLSPYVVAVGATAVAQFARWLLEPLLVHRLPFATMYAAIAVAVWAGGWKPGLLTTVLGFFGSSLLFIGTEAGSPLSLSGIGGITGMALYLLTSAIVIALGSGMRSARLRAEAAVRENSAKHRELEAEVAEHRRTEQDLVAKERELEQVTRQTPLMLTRCNRERRFVFVNRACAEFLGQRAEDIVGRSIADVLGEAAASTIAPNVDRVLRGEVVEFELEIPYAAVGTRTMHATYTPDRDASGDTIGWFATIEDVTAYRRALKELGASEARLAAEARMLNKLHALSSRLWRMTDLRQGLEETLGATIELMSADLGNVQVFEPERDVLRIAAQRGFEQDFLDLFAEVSMADDSACGRALRPGERTVVPDVESDPAYAPLRPIASAAGYRAVQSTPLLARDGRVLGVLSTHWRSVHEPNEQALRWLDLYARQAAYFIERCRTDEALREADRRKDEFLATLAHELRNPLSPVKNAIQILHLRGSPSPEVQWARDVIDRQVQQMTRLIDDLMDVSRITRNRLELRKALVDLEGVLRGAIETVRPLVDGCRHRLTTTLPPEPILVDADSTRLAQVFANLLNNAAKYSEPGATIDVDVQRRGREAVVCVRDHGIGIPADLLPHVFDGFARTRKKPAHGRGGLGIGLSLVKRLVEMHGGSVTAHSAGEGHGSEFVVRLPAVSSPPALRPTRAPAPSLVAAPSPRRVLVVDDNRDSVETLGRMLGMLGYETRTAGDGLEALGIAAEFHPELMLLDLGMPKMDGYEVARRVRTQIWGKNTVLVAITGWGQEQDRQRTAEAGFEQHLVKPVEMGALSKLLATLGAKASV